jgi:hypothetical protein
VDLDALRAMVGAAHEGRGVQPRVERARDAEPGERDREDSRACRRAGGLRWRTGSAAPARRLRRARRRLLRVQRSQDVRTDGDRRPAGAPAHPRGDAPLSVRRGHDRVRARRGEHVERAAAQVRGGDAERGRRRRGSQRRATTSTDSGSSRCSSTSARWCG